MDLVFESQRFKKYIPFEGSFWTADDLVAGMSSRTGSDDMGVMGDMGATRVGGSLIGPKEYTGAAFL
jgi:hypothetical protein